jgi:hypothetical protein
MRGGVGVGNCCCPCRQRPRGKDSGKLTWNGCFLLDSTDLEALVSSADVVF